jgi:cytochrome c oxidase subunit 4
MSSVDPGMAGHSHAPHHEPASMLMYFSVFFALLILTGVTVWISTINLGVMNTPVALAIAVVKASLVILFFMHVIHSTRLTWVVVVASDYLTRDWTLYTR